MATLSYTAITSLDGFIEDESGTFEWAMPDAEVHEYINDLERTIGTHLYGRRMYETMAVWESMGSGPDDHPAEVDYAQVWRGLDKVVYSRTLDALTTTRTRLVREFDADEVRQLVASAERDVSIAGPGLAEHAFRAGLVDDVHLFVFPLLVGGGKPGLPRGVTLELELVDQRRFANGVVHLHHRRP